MKNFDTNWPNSTNLPTGLHFQMHFFLLSPHDDMTWHFGYLHLASFLPDVTLFFIDLLNIRESVCFDQIVRITEQRWWPIVFRFSMEWVNWDSCENYIGDCWCVDCKEKKCTLIPCWRYFYCPLIPRVHGKMWTLLLTCYCHIGLQYWLTTEKIEDSSVKPDQLSNCPWLVSSN